MSQANNDSAVAGIIKQVFLYYFKLGGVLVATTNRLPEGYPL
jgi:predicted ATPase